MTKKILKILFINMTIVAIAVTIYALGYEYDKAHELYPESEYFGFAISTYGKRWSRLSRIILFGLLIFDCVVILIWFRNRQMQQAKKNSIFVD